MDLGILFYASQSGAQTYTDAKGTTRTAQTLTNANYLVSDSFYVGRNQALTLSVGGVISVGMASATVIVEAQQVDAANPSTVQWGVIGTTRGDSPSTAPAASQTITRANLAGQSVDAGSGAAVETLDVRLMTADAQGSGLCRVIVKAANAPQSGDKVIVRGTVL